MIDFQRYPISEFFGPDGNAYDRFSRENIPSKETFRKLFNSVLFSAEAKHSAGIAHAGHVVLASATEVKERAYSSDFTKVVDVTMIPGLMLSDATGYTIHGTEVLKDGLSMHEYTNDTTGAKDFMIDFLANSSFFKFDITTKKLEPNGTVSEGVYWGTQAGLTEMGFWPISDSTSDKVAVAGIATADYLNADQFHYFDNTVHVALKLGENQVFVGFDFGTHVTAKATDINDAFNRSFGFEAGDVPMIASPFATDAVVVTTSASYLKTVTMNDGFNLELGVVAGTVSEGNHVHGVFETLVAGFVPAPGTIDGKVLSDNGVWVDMATAGGDTYKLMMSSGDGTPDYMDGKVDDSSLYVFNNILKVKPAGIGLDEISSSILRYAEIEVTTVQMAQIYSNPITVVSVETLVDQVQMIHVVDAVVEVDHINSDFDTNTTLVLKHETATDNLMEELKAIESTASRTLGFLKVGASTISSTQYIKDKDLIVTSLVGNPNLASGASSTYTIKVWYRITRHADAGGEA